MATSEEAEPGPPGGRRRRLLALTPLAGVTLATALVTALTVAYASGSPTVPSQWGPGIAPVASQVSQIRGLDFSHPVEVRFLTSDEFKQKVSAGALTPADRRSEQEAQDQLRSLGLVPDSTNLVTAADKATKADTEGYYEPSTQQIFIRGPRLDDATSPVLAHELTHAIQDQHFGLDKVRGKAPGSTGQFATTSLIEGDAVRVQDTYLQGLSSSAQQAYEKGQQAAGARQPSSVPEVVIVIQDAPYVLGLDFNETLVAKGGNQAVDDAFRHPPTTGVQILDPAAFIQHSPLRKVATPALGSGEAKEGGASEFGALSLYVTLADRIDPVTALQAADAWGGDSSVQFKRGTTACTRAAFAGRTGAGTLKMASALTRWAAAMPAGSATVSAAHGTVTLTSCDPGSSYTASKSSLMQALTVADARNANTAIAIKEGLPVNAAVCIGNAVIRDPALLKAEQSTSNLSPSQQSALQARAQAIGQRCRTHPGSVP